MSRLVWLAVWLLGAASLVAAQATVIRYAPAVGLKTHYQTYNSATLEPDQITLTASDRSTVSPALLEQYRQAFFGIRLENTSDYVDTVLSSVDGNTRVKTEGASATKIFKAATDELLNASANLGFAAEASYQADGALSVTSFFYDTANLPLSTAAQLRQNQSAAKELFALGIPRVYNQNLDQDFDPGLIFKLNIFSGNLIATTDLSASAHFSGSDETLGFHFDLNGTPSSAQNNASLSNGQKVFLRLEMEAGQGSMQFLADGRLKELEFGAYGNAIYTFIIPDGKRSLTLRYTAHMDFAMYLRALEETPTEK